MNQGNNKSHKNNSQKSLNISPEKKIMRTYAKLLISKFKKNCQNKKNIKKIKLNIIL